MHRIIYDAICSFWSYSIFCSPSNVNSVKHREPGNWHIRFLSFLFFSFSFYTRLFNSNKIIHRITSCTIYFISIQLFWSLIIHLQQHQPSKNMVSDLSLLAFTFFFYHEPIKSKHIIHRFIWYEIYLFSSYFISWIAIQFGLH